MWKCFKKDICDNYYDMEWLVGINISDCCNDGLQ